MIEIIDFKKKPITDIAKGTCIDESVLYNYGKYIAKVPYDYYPYNFEEGEKAEKAKLVLVTAMTPTKSGEGKTLTSVGLSMALNKLGKKTVACLRQGSMGPTFGMKGTCVGSGHSVVLPAEELALGFTGDLDAVTSANNLLSAIIDNHIYQGNKLKIHKVVWKRCLDVCDRSLRDVKTGWSKKGVETELESHFDITAASEILTILTLSESMEEVKERLGNIIIGYTNNNIPVYAKQLRCVGALTSILSKAFNPNLVQTCESTPVLIHGGCFANISCGTSTLVSTKLGMRLGDYVVTEAGFAADLGAEKFLDMKCRKGGIEPDCVVLVVTVKALKHHGEGDVQLGLDNMIKHVQNLSVTFNQKVVVALNKFPEDTEEEIKYIRGMCDLMDVPFSVSEAFSKGSEGCLDLAEKVVAECNKFHKELTFAYDLKDGIFTKINKVATKIYGSKGIEVPKEVMDKILRIEELGYKELPICIAKTQYSLSDNPKLLNNPYWKWTLKVRDVELKAGAGFIVVVCGDIVTMPGLPKEPNAEHIDVVEGKVIGLS